MRTHSFNLTSPIVFYRLGGEVGGSDRTGNVVVHGVLDEADRDFDGDDFACHGVARCKLAGGGGLVCCVSWEVGI